MPYVIGKTDLFLLKSLLMIVFIRIFLAGLLDFSRFFVNTVGLLLILTVSLFMAVRWKQNNIVILSHPVLLLLPICLMSITIDLAFDADANIALAINELFRISSYIFIFSTLTTYLKRLPHENQLLALRYVSNWAAVLSFSLASYGIYRYLQGDVFILSSGFAETTQNSELAAGLAVNPNAFGAILTLSISGLLFAPNSIIDQKVKLFIVIITFAAIILSGSRTSILALFFAISIIALRRPIYLIPFSILILCGFALIATQMVDIGLKSYSSISWRWVTWTQLVQDMSFSNVVFGKGPGEVERFLSAQALWVVTEPHNDYLRMLYTFGVGGLVYFSIIFRPKPLDGWRKMMTMHLNAPVIAFIMLSLSENVFRDSNATIVALIWMAFRTGLARPYLWHSKVIDAADRDQPSEQRST